MAGEQEPMTLNVSDVQAIADAITLQMLTLPREIERIVRPHFTFVTSLDPMTKTLTENLQLRIMTDADGMWLEFTMHGQMRVALLRFNYRGWAWQEHRR